MLMQFIVYVDDIIISRSNVADIISLKSFLSYNFIRKIWPPWSILIKELTKRTKNNIEIKWNGSRNRKICVLNSHLQYTPNRYTEEKRLSPIRISAPILQFPKTWDHDSWSYSIYSLGTCHLTAQAIIFYVTNSAPHFFNPSLPFENKPLMCL